MIYFVQAGENGPVKIGYTAGTVKGRVSTIANDSMTKKMGLSLERLSLLATLSGFWEEEQRLHRKFAHLRIDGEWFRSERDLMDFVGNVGFQDREDAITTTITIPEQTAIDVKTAAQRAGVGWTQMMAVLIRQALDAGVRK